MARRATHPTPRKSTELRFRFDALSPIGHELVIAPTLLLIWQHVVQGATVREIAGLLHLSEKTIKNYLSELYDVLGLPGSVQHHSRTLAAVLGWFMMSRYPALATPVIR